MPRDPERVAEVRAWFLKAAEDLRAAEFELGAEPPLTTDILFHAQQAVEKSMKGFLAWHDRRFRKTPEQLSVADPLADPPVGDARYYLAAVNCQGQRRAGRWSINGVLQGRNSAALPGCQ